MEPEIHMLHPDITKLFSISFNDTCCNVLFQFIENSKEALNKIRRLSFEDESKLDGQTELFIRILPNRSNKTLTIIDSGIGMTSSDLRKLGTTATKGVKDFVSGRLDIVRGFYSAYMISDKVVVSTKHNDDEQYVWECHAGNGVFTVYRDTSSEAFGSRGTRITLFLKECNLEYVNEQFLKDSAPRCGFVDYPVSLWLSHLKDSVFICVESVLDMACSCKVITVKGLRYNIEGKIISGRGSAIRYLRENKDDVYKTVLRKSSLVFATKYGFGF